MTISPLNDNVIVKVLQNESEGGGVLLPDTHEKETFGMGEVVAVEKGLPVKVGDRVVFDKVLLTNVKVEGEELQFIKFSDILGYGRVKRVAKTGVDTVVGEEVREAEGSETAAGTSESGSL